MKKRKSKRGKRLGSKWTRGKKGAPAPHGAVSEMICRRNVREATSLSVIVVEYEYTGVVCAADTERRTGSEDARPAESEASLQPSETRSVDETDPGRRP